MLISTRRFILVFTIGLALISVTGVWLGVHSIASATDDDPVSPLAAPSPSAITEASLHNPTFDAHRWYWFHERYDPGYYWLQALLPDDDVPGGSQDWRLWFARPGPGSPSDYIESWAEGSLAQSVEAVTTRVYQEGPMRGGLYQVVRNTTPCLVYNFEMYGMSLPDPGTSPYSALQVGIHPTGQHPDSAYDPAVNQSLFDSIEWGPPHDYKFSYGPLTVTVEALHSQIVVYTYAYALGGHRHAILWDTGSLQDVTPEMIHDPDNLPAPGGISNSNETPGSTVATITWNTANEALGQVYYRLLPSGETPPDYPNKVYLPLVLGSNATGWLASSIEPTPTTDHTATLSGLTPDRTYEYIIVSRGLSGGECTTWVSAVGNFTTEP